MTESFKSIYLFNVPLRIDFLSFLLPVSFIAGNWIVSSILTIFIFLLFFSSKVIVNISEFKIPYFIYWAFLLLWGIYIASKSPNLKNGIEYYIGIILVPFMIYLIFNNIRLDIKFLEILINMFIASGVILSLVSIYIFIDSGLDLKLRISSLWQDSNIISFYLLILLFCNLSLLVNKKSISHFILYLLSSILILLGIILTQTRGVYISLLLGVSILIIKKPKIIIPSVIISGVLVMLFFQIFESRFLSIKYFGNDVSSLGRLQAWFSTLILLKENFFFGYGFNSFKYLRDQVFGFYFVEVEHSHNTYLRAMLEMGFIGFVFYFYFFFRSLFFVFSRKAGELTEYKKFIDGFKMIFIACLSAFMFEPYFSLYGVSTIVLWIFMSISISLKKMSENGNSSQFNLSK